jgi:cob(I)alamin adenosyltransferase
MADFFTRQGDEGYTGLLGEGKVPKYHPRTTTFGDIDEASAVIGIARASIENSESREFLIQIQRHLYLIMAEVSSTPENASKFRSIDENHVKWLENQTNAIAERIIIPKEFIIPGDTLSGAYLDFARTIVRRAERGIAKLYHNGELSNKHLLHYFNRLSSFLFVLELSENSSQGYSKPSLAKG